jgi:hypothetical protein
MPNRTPKFLSTIVAGCLAGAALTSASHGATPEPPAADACLSGPKDPAPSGSHWYYRIERGTKRHCWYIGAQHDMRAQTAPSKVASTAPSAAPAAPKAEAAMPGTVVNAHAELAALQTRGAQEASAASQVPSTASAGAANIGNSATANAVDGDAQQSLIATRWPDQADEPDVPEAATDNSGASQQKLAAAQPPATPPAASPIAATPLAAADASSAKQSGSIRTLLIVIAGALALAGLVGSAIFRFGGRWWTKRREIEEDDRSELWDVVRADHRSRPVFQEPPAEPRLAVEPRPARYPGDLRAAGVSRATSASAEVTPLRTANAPRAASIPRLASAARAANDPDDKIAEMLARLARSAQS